jgi:glycosyltransferase involved in cell wall biosynthesis
MVTLRGSELLHGQSRSKRWLMGWALRRAALVVTMSAELSRFATGLGAAAGKVNTIPNGVDGTVFFPQDRTQARLKHRLPADAKVILSAGHLIELKRHHDIIKALHKLRQDGLDAHLLIAGGPGGGGPSWEDRLHRLAFTLGIADAIRFLGPVEQSVLAELMAAADVFCLASAREGCPNVVNEAMACGTPVVATRVGAVPILIPSEQYGFIVPAQDEAALYQALQQALQKSWDHASIAARGQSRSWRQVARELLAQIRQAIPPV